MIIGLEAPTTDNGRGKYDNNLGMMNSTVTGQYKIGFSHNKLFCDKKQKPFKGLERELIVECLKKNPGLSHKEIGDKCNIAPELAEAIIKGMIKRNRVIQEEQYGGYILRESDF